MAEQYIAKIKMPSNSEIFNLKDADARSRIEALESASTVIQTSATLASSLWSGSTYTLSVDLKCGNDGSVSPLIYPLGENDEFNKIINAAVTPGTNVVFTTDSDITSDISLLILDFQ